jgi:cytochrome c peroxidase
LSFRPTAVLLALAAIVGIACGGCRSRVSDKPVGAAVFIKIPLGLPPLPVPRDNPPTAASIALGRALFYDKHLSQDDSLACASCHNPQSYFTDRQRLSKGIGGLSLRNAPTVMNAAYLPFQFWDGRALTLEEQSASPIADPLEMSQPHNVSVKKIAAGIEYKGMFAKAFGSEDVTIGRIENALASFERTLLSGDSPFDRYQYGGDQAALTLPQARGLAVFLDPNKGNCVACHTVRPHDALFTDGKFHNTGEGVGDLDQFSDIGRYHETKVKTDTGAFKTPTLRNVAETGPYMHDGRLKALKEVVDFYAGGGNSNLYLDPEMKKIHLNATDREDLVAFMQSLTGQMPPDVGPPGRK